jgi:hypothetical protein
MATIALVAVRHAMPLSGLRLTDLTDVLYQVEC